MRGDIIATLERQAREAELEGLVADVNAALAAGESLESIAENKGLEWRVELAATRQNTLLPPEVLQAAFAKQASDTNSVSAIGVTSGVRPCPACEGHSWKRGHTPYFREASVSRRGSASSGGPVVH